MCLFLFVFFCLSLTHLCCWLKDQQPLSLSRDLSVCLVLTKITDQFLYTLIHDLLEKSLSGTVLISEQCDLQVTTCVLYKAFLFCVCMLYSDPLRVSSCCCCWREKDELKQKPFMDIEYCIYSKLCCLIEVIKWQRVSVGHTWLENSSFFMTCHLSHPLGWYLWFEMSVKHWADSVALQTSQI